MQEYETGSIRLKAIGEPIRLQILDILSGGELCACDILQNMRISQPTLSHHMKALTESGWVIARKKATWMYYSINVDAVEKIHQYLLNLTSKKTDAANRESFGSGPCCCPLENSPQK